MTSSKLYVYMMTKVFDATDAQFLRVTGDPKAQARTDSGEHRASMLSVVFPTETLRGCKKFVSASKRKTLTGRVA